MHKSRFFQTGMFFVLASQLGCAGLIAGRLRKPGEVRKDGNHGWLLSGVMLPVKGEQIVRLDAKQVERSGEAEISLVLNTSDKPLDCNQVTLTGATAVTLTKVRFMEVGRGGSSAQGRVPMAELKSASASPGIKINWCDVELALDDAQVGKLKEFTEMAGGE